MYKIFFVVLFLVLPTSKIIASEAEDLRKEAEQLLWYSDDEDETYEKAAKLYKKAAEKGDGIAMMMLAYDYYTGDNYRKNKELAIKLSKKAYPKLSELVKEKENHGPALYQMHKYYRINSDAFNSRLFLFASALEGYGPAHYQLARGHYYGGYGLAHSRYIYYLHVKV